MVHYHLDFELGVDCRVNKYNASYQNTVDNKRQQHLHIHLTRHVYESIIQDLVTS
jgi:hypothetical protein